MRFSEKMFILRKRYGYTQAELAKLSNVSQSAIQGYETGRIYPFPNTIIQLAKVLDVTVQDLIEDERSI